MEGEKSVGGMQNRSPSKRQSSTVYGTRLPHNPLEFGSARVTDETGTGWETFVAAASLKVAGSPAPLADTPGDATEPALFVFSPSVTNVEAAAITGIRYRIG